MTPAAILFFLLIVPFFVVLAAWVRHEWPAENPLWDRMAMPVGRRHFRG
jgi:hypothetical protein